MRTAFCDLLLTAKHVMYLNLIQSHMQQQPTGHRFRTNVEKSISIGSFRPAIARLTVTYMQFSGLSSLLASLLRADTHLA